MTSDDQAKSDNAGEMLADDPLDASDSQNGTNAIDSYMNDVDAFLSSESHEEQREEPVSAEPAEPEEPQESAEDESEELVDEEAQEEPKVQTRFRLTSEEDRAVAAIAKARGSSWVEAFRIYDRIKTEESTAEANTETSAEQLSPLDAVKAEFKELSEKRKARFKAFDFDDVAEIDDQLEEVREKRFQLQAEKERNEITARHKEEAAYHEGFDSSTKSASRIYPDSIKEGSKMWAEIQRLDDQMREMEDPLYYSPEKPMILAKQAGARLGIPMTRPDEKKPATKTVATVRPQPAGGNARTTSTDPKGLAMEIEKVGTMAEYEALLERVF